MKLKRIVTIFTVIHFQTFTLRASHLHKKYSFCGPMHIVWQEISRSFQKYFILKHLERCHMGLMASWITGNLIVYSSSQGDSN